MYIYIYIYTYICIYIYTYKYLVYIYLSDICHICMRNTVRIPSLALMTRSRESNVIHNETRQNYSRHSRVVRDNRRKRKEKRKRERSRISSEMRIPSDLASAEIAHEEKTTRATLYGPVMLFGTRDSRQAEVREVNTAVKKCIPH